MIGVVGLVAHRIFNLKNLEQQSQKAHQIFSGGLHCMQDTWPIAREIDSSSSLAFRNSSTNCGPETTTVHCEMVAILKTRPLY